MTAIHGLRSGERVPHSRARRGRVPVPWLMLLALGLALTLAMAWLERDSGVLGPDSREYLAFSPLRPWGYPAFLRLVGLLGDPVVTVPPLQMLALLAAAVFLAGTVVQATRSRLAGALALFLALANPIVYAYAYAVTTEALATALAMVVLALLLRLFMRPSVGTYAALCAVAAAGYALRPAGLVFVPFLLLLLAYNRARLGLPWRPQLLALLVAGVAAHGSTLAAGFLVHGQAGGGGNLGTGLLGKALLLAPGQQGESADARRLAELGAPVAAALDRVADPRLRGILTHEYVNFLRFGVLFPAWHAEAGRSDAVERNRRAGAVAAEVLRADPAGFLRLAGQEAFMLLAMPHLATVGEQLAFRQELRRLAPWPHDGATGVNWEEGYRELSLHVLTPLPGGAGNIRHRPAVLVHGFRLAYAVTYLAWGLAVAAALLLARPPPWVQAVAAAGTLYLGTVAMTALGDVGGMRYTVPIWPCVALTLALLAWAALRLLPRGAR